MSNPPGKKPHVPSVDENWLSSNPEERVPLDTEIVDSHIHLWDFSDPAYLGDRYAQDARANGISTSVYIECTMGYRETGPDSERSVGEVAFARDQAERFSSKDLALAAGIVGMLDVTRDSEVERLLDLMAEAAGGRFRGIRIRAAHDADPAVGYGAGGIPPGILGLSETRRSLALLERAGLSLDVYAFHTQLEEIASLARDCPQLPIVVNHLGGPIGVGPYAENPLEVFRHWKRGISALAPLPNVFMKIGGFAISRLAIVSSDGRSRPVGSAELARLGTPWFEQCLENFGANRCLFGSNFPVDKNAMSMTVLVNAMTRLTASLTVDERHAILSRTARRVYRI